jgi:hypothetical protein
VVHADDLSARADRGDHGREVTDEHDDEVSEAMGRSRDSHGARAVRCALLLGALFQTPIAARADEGGASFWIPGFFGSLAAAPAEPGWSLISIDYYDSVKAGGDVALARAVTIHAANTTFNTSLQASISASLNTTVDAGFLIPTYTFEQRFFGAQTTVGMITALSYERTTLQGMVQGTLGPLGFSKSGTITDQVTAPSDLIPIVEMRWNAGVNKFMLYGAANLPAGQYDSSSLANTGIGHYVLDGGVGYTYLDTRTGHEFSAVAGFSHNYINPYTQYMNGTDFHLDWGASQFLTKQLMIGAVGYVYDQLTGDSGAGDHVGPFMSRVVGVGPQIGYIFPLGNYQGYVNLKGYGEFDAHDRPMATTRGSR